MDLKTILSTEPAYRQKQIEKAWFDVKLNSYEEITTLPVELREQLKNIPWLSVTQHVIQQSREDNTRRILFKLHDGEFIETVLMGRASRKSPLGRGRGGLANTYEPTPGLEADPAQAGTKDRYTICISSEVGCPMRCTFCATGKAGFTRNLTAEEIIDQYRYCQRLLAKDGARVNNIVVMGQGEPLLNYENIKRALLVLLKNTDLGETKITVSTAGVPAAMEKILTDETFPAVRWAVSLHSAIEETRKKIMPSNKKGFLEFLIKWSHDYHQKFGTRTHFIGLEYIMLSGVNDDDKHLQALIKLGKKMPHVRINLIPYNSINKDPIDNISTFNRTKPETIEHWHDALMKAGFTSTIRYSQGQDIAAACGQLSNQLS